MVLYVCCRTGDLPELRFKLHLFFDCLVVLHNKVGVVKADSSMGPLLIVAMVLNTKWCRLTFAPEKYEESVLSSTWSLQGPYLML